VKNTSAVAGSEIVQLYVRDLVGSVTRPVKELKGFQKISLTPAEEKTVSFKLTEQDLRFYNNELKLESEPGEFEVFCGTDSNTQNSARFTLEK
jgi:beta-glucosidase